jgi:uncharacterized protein YycO
MTTATSSVYLTGLPAVGSYKPGDFILCHATAPISRLIELGERLRFGWRSPYAYWSHAALIISAEGQIVEANAEGIQQKSLAEYVGTGFCLVNVPDAIMSAEDRAEAVAFAQSCIGEPYGYLTAVSIGLSVLTGLRMSFGFDGQEVCSGLVARALERSAIIFPRDPSHLTPGDLAQYFQVVRT